MRRALPSEAHALAEMHVAAWRTAYAELMPCAAIEAHTVDDRREQWTAALADPAMGALLVEDEEGIAGFALFGAPEEPDVDEGTGVIFGIYLLPRAIGIGVGRDLLERVTRGLVDLGYERGVLWVLEANARARRFYEAAGWRTDGTSSPHLVGVVDLPVVRYTRALREPRAVPAGDRS